MGHIDEAMKRAAGTAGEATADAGADAQGVAEGERSPWDLEARAADGASTRLIDQPSARGGGRQSPAPQTTRFQEMLGRLAERMVVSGQMPPESVEQYRRLAAILHHAQMDRGIKTVMVTSALGDEGKTLTATNLALTLSESYMRQVLLIDGDLRRPALHAVFNLPNASGLSEALRAPHAQRFPVVQVSPHLTVLTAGRPDPDPMGGLTSPRMRQAMEEAAAKFDWVIVDTPPIGILPDAHLLSGMVDSALLVIRAGKTPCVLVQRAIEAIGRERIIGVVLNRVADHVVKTDYSYYAPR